MSVFAIIWVLVVTVVTALAMRNALEMFRHPRKMRSSVIYMNPQQARHAALGTLIVAPIVWLLFVLSSFGLLGPSPF